MLRPSYNDLMESVNADVVDGEQPVMNSRYGIVIATAKRARQIIAGASVLVDDAEGKKPLSTAIDEIYKEKVHLVSEDAKEEAEEAFTEEAESEAEAIEE